MSKKEIIFLLLIVLSFWSCTEKKKLSSDEKYEKEIDKLFADYPKMDLDSNLLNIEFAHRSFFDTNLFSDFRYDLFHWNGIIRSWVRTYNIHDKYFKEFRYQTFEDRVENLLIISEDSKAAIIKWKNTDISKLGDFFTNDLEENTKFVETNLPAEIIKKYYPQVKCKINTVKIDTLKIDLSKLFLIM